jgi:putative oxidoreductase
MPRPLQGLLGLLGRILFCAIFVMSTVANKILNFNGTVKMMEDHNVPLAQVALVGAIVFLLVGSASVIVGYKARIGALLLLVFLILATYFFHVQDYLNYQKAGDEPHMMNEMIHTMKNVALMGAALFIMGNGAGAWSLDALGAAKGK